METIIMEKKMETTILLWLYWISLGLYWGFIGIVEEKMEAMSWYCKLVL